MKKHATVLRTPEEATMKYWIGDPCYHTMFSTSQGGSHDLWLKLLNETDYFENCGQPVQFEGRRIAAHSTAHGDGVYFDDQSREYGVDSGALGFIEWLEGDPETIDGLHLIEFKSLPYIVYYAGGVIAINGADNVLESIDIDTDPVVDREDEEEGYSDIEYEEEEADE
jgi:hypothetical protein